MIEVKWSNLQTAAPLCKHAIEEALNDGCADVVPSLLGVEEFSAMIRRADATLYAPRVHCRHDVITKGECDGE